MNSSHYPDIERCKKLTEIGFPETEYFRNRKGQIDVIPYDVCPSVMELLDVIPRDIKHRGRLRESIWSFRMNKTHGWYIGPDEHDIIDFDSDPNTLPNALADLTIWLVENGYLTFKK